jgi:hypothetical protein
MPYIQDTRCGDFRIDLNVNSVIQYLQEKLDCEYTGEPPVKGSMFWNYVCCLEGKVDDNVREYPDEMKQYGIWGYIDDYYDEIDAWNDVKEFFVEEEEEEEERIMENIGSIDIEGYMKYMESKCPQGHKTVWYVKGDKIMYYNYVKEENEMLCKERYIETVEEEELQLFADKIISALSTEEEEMCPSCGEEWTDATRCDCPNE